MCRRCEGGGSDGVGGCRGADDLELGDGDLGGPGEQSSQAVSFVVSNNNSGLFSGQPVVAANGTLTFTPAANANGSALVTVR